jgi:dihydroorotate dehydrogenase
MYARLIRPLLFLLSPETVHHLVVFLLRIILAIPGKLYFFKKLYSVRDSRLERNLFGLKFDNPVGLAAGFDKNASFYKEMSAFGFSFVEIGTVTPEPQTGNSKPRLFRLPDDKALINRMGLNNQGVKKVASRLKKERKNLVVGGNIGKNTLTPDENAIRDYATAFQELYDYVDYFTVNLSCPNVGSISRLQEKDFQLELFTELKRIDGQLGKNKPIFVKIAPELNLHQIDEMIEIVRMTGITGIVATNTTKERNDLITNPAVINKIGPGGLSGLPLKDRSTEVIRYISEKTRGQIPVIGVGGIMSPEDAIEKLEAGACLVQLYTGFIYEGPAVVKKINKAILRRSE